MFREILSVQPEGSGDIRVRLYENGRVTAESDGDIVAAGLWRWDRGLETQTRSMFGFRIGVHATRAAEEEILQTLADDREALAPPSPDASPLSYEGPTYGGPTDLERRLAGRLIDALAIIDGMVSRAIGPAEAVRLLPPIRAQAIEVEGLVRPEVEDADP